ncbi:hypothetical protein Golomagni_00268 [Golovinomyces magnicellulatus]|nr:hypothetical protein Golomagni_00268 [Golovinomyces magnicellulatus]
MYREEDRYSGIDDSFNLCLGIFYDTCRKSGNSKPLFKDALSTIIKGSAREYYHMNLMDQDYSFDQMTHMLKSQFETIERQQQMLLKWKTIKLRKKIEQYSTKSYTECFEITVKELRRTQLSLPKRFKGNESPRDAIIDTIRDIRECSLACFKPAITVEALCADIRASIATEERIKQGSSTFHSHINASHDSNISQQQLYTDFRYGGNRISRPPNNLSRTHSPKVCFVGKKNGCWSSKHTKEERNKAYNAFRERLQALGKPFNDRHIRNYVVEFEVEHSDTTDEEQDIWDNLIMNVYINESDEDDNLLIDSQYITPYSPIN